MKPIVLLDIDDVLVDWRAAAIAVGGEKVNEICDAFHAGGEMRSAVAEAHLNLWGLIKAHPTFWTDIPKTEWCDELISHIEGLGVDWFFCTAHSRNDERSATQKVQWVHKNGWDSQKKLVITHEKWLLASPNKILIDDRDENCFRFEKAGGHTVVMPHKWNKASPFIDRRMNFVKSQLNRCLEQIRGY